MVETALTLDGTNFKNRKLRINMANQKPSRWEYSTNIVDIFEYNSLYKLLINICNNPSKILTKE